MAKRQATIVAVFGLALAGGPIGAEAGPIGRRLQQWSQGQSQVYTAQPSQTKNIDLNLTQASYVERFRQRLPWRKSKTLTAGYEMKTEYMKHRNDGTLVH